MAQYSPTEYSLSVYSNRASPDRPGTPSSFECYLMLEGGHSSATDLLPSRLQQAKRERLTDDEEYRRAIFNASFLQAENSWLRRTRTSAVALHEDTVEPAAEMLAHSLEEIHDALTQFHIAFGAVEQSLPTIRNPFASDVEKTLEELIPAFETCRKGLEKARAVSIKLERGGKAFSDRIKESNKSYAKFFGINYNEGEEIKRKVI